MLPDPLHPAVVHLPIALSVLLPLLSVLGALSVARGWLPRRSWAGVVFLYVVLLASGFAALETGEDEEERVEKVVAEEHIEEHAERAEWFLWIAGIGAVAAAAGLQDGPRGTLARSACVLLSLAVLAAGIRVGHAGGELVYRHGAASAYLEQEPTH